MAVIDTGVKAAHPDLAGKVVGGWNFVNNNSDYTDRNGHGTHVAGIIAASADNGKGVTGGCWGCRILAERVMPDSGHGGDDAHIAAGISHAVAHGASVLNLSIGGANRSEAVVKALADAYYTNRVVVAAAGNNGSSKKIYPGAYDVETFTSWFGLFPRTYYVPNLTVAATTSADKRADFSNFGSWVDIAAPGVGILSSVTNPNNLSEGFPACTNTDYCQLDGTSQATPQVAAAAALMRANNPKLDESVVRLRIKSTAKPLPDKSIGSGLLDTFSAIVNSGFDTGTLQDWASTGTASVISALGPIRPVDGTLRMARASTGPGGAVVSSTLKRSLKVLPGSGDIVVRLKYNYVTEEYPEFVGSQFNDDLTITLVTPDGTRIPLAFESVNTTGWTPISGINFPGGDATVGQSGWKSVATTIPGIQLEGASSFTVEISDRGDGIFDSEAILDGLRLA